MSHRILSAPTHFPNWLRNLLLVLSGAMHTLTVAPFDYWWIAPVAVMLFLWAGQFLSTETPLTAKQGFRRGWWMGVGLFGVGVSWVYVSINTYGHAPPVLAGGLTLGFVLGLSLFPALTFWLFARLRSANLITNALLFIATWILGDGFRTVFLTGFPWLFLGYGHLETVLAGWIPVLGIYGLTGIVVATGVAIYLFLSDMPLRQKYLFAFPVALFWLAGPIWNQIEWTQPKEDKDLSVLLLQPNIDQEVKWLPSQRQITLDQLETLSFGHDQQHDLIVWPETAVPLFVDQATPFLEAMSELATQRQTTIISGIVHRQKHEDGQSIVMHNTVLGLGLGSGIYHKQQLVPFGEYVPLQEMLRGLISFFDLPMSDFRRGPADQPLLTQGPHQLAPFICYEVVYPDFVAALAYDADYLLTISNDAWFGRSIGPIQHLQMAQFRAAENRRWMVRGTNNGVTGIIDPRGQITTQAERFTDTTLSGIFKAMTGHTPFARFGSQPLFILAFAMCLFSLRQRVLGASS